jgi:uncharacterized protein (DUF1697 family)
MIAYIALLRGINVGGNRKVKMEVLRGIFENMEFQKVRTYIQTGNVLFETEETETKSLMNKIADRLKNDLGFEVTVIVRKLDEFHEVVRNCPFEAEKYDKLYITFLSDEPTLSAIDNIKSITSETEELKIIKREVYLICNKSYHEALFSNNFLEKKLGVFATTRNWNTLNKLIAMG